MNQSVYTFTSEQIRDGIWAIDDNGMDLMYLVAGTKKALLIDTGMGFGDLADYVGTLTRLPVTVVNTHGHIDHAGGNYRFKEAFMHPSDRDLYLSLFSEQGRERRKEQLAHPEFAISEKESEELLASGPRPTKPAAEGMIFDLGGRRLKVLETPGHTHGSICLVDRENRQLFSGDTTTPEIWMHLDCSTSLENFLETERRLGAMGGSFDEIFPGHGERPVGKERITDLIECAQGILEGKYTGVPFETIAGSGLRVAYKEIGLVYKAR